MPDLNANVRVRAAKLSDAPELAALLCELGYETTSDEMRMRLKSILPHAGYGTFVAKIGKELCGMIGTHCCHSYAHNDVGGRILALVVTEEMRDQGIGRALITVAENDFTERNITRVAVNTRFTRADAHRFYESLGYTRNGFRFVKELPAVAD